MSLVVQCFQCSQYLELDEGFRGAICRCSHCGTLLEVPDERGKTAKKKRPAAPESVGSSSSAAQIGADTGLSSGITSPLKDRMASAVVARAPAEHNPAARRRPATPDEVPPGRNDKLFLLGIALVIGITLIIATIVYYVLVLHPEKFI